MPTSCLLRRLARALALPSQTYDPSWNYVSCAALGPAMFLFFSNRLGAVGSIIVSIALNLLLVYACSGP